MENYLSLTYKLMDVIFQDGDQTSLSFVARSLMTLQQLYGTIPSVYGLGNCAKVYYY